MPISINALWKCIRHYNIFYKIVYSAEIQTQLLGLNKLIWIDLNLVDSKLIYLKMIHFHNILSDVTVI